MHMGFREEEYEGSMAFMTFMIYVVMYLWLMRERCTYPSVSVAIENNNRSVKSVMYD